jgi:TonB family protein
MSKRAFLLLLLVPMMAWSRAQSNATVEEEPVFAIAEQMPEFPGGATAIRGYLMKHFEFPEEAMNAQVNGPVVVSFIVTKNGDVREVRVTRGQHPALDAETVRVLSAMPKWKPGRQHGQAVNVLFNMPVRIASPTPSTVPASEPAH